MIREDPETGAQVRGVCKFALCGEGGRTFIVDLHRQPASDRR